MNEATIRMINMLSMQMIGDRTNVAKMRSWVAEHHRYEAGLMDSFDSVITSFNTYNPDDLPNQYKNFHRLKGSLNGTPLPTLNEMMQNPKWTHFLRFAKTLRQVNHMMTRGETTMEEPYIAFHTKPTDTEALVIGTMFHIIEEHFLLHAGLSVNRGDIEGTLIEVLSLQRENPLWDAISNTSRLNWIDGWQGFTQEFRNQLGFR